VCVSFLVSLRGERYFYPCLENKQRLSDAEQKQMEEKYEIMQEQHPICYEDPVVCMLGLTEAEEAVHGWKSSDVLALPPSIKKQKSQL